jgi:dynein heavy chain
MPEEIDPSIESIVSKSFYNEEGVLKISLGGKSIDYDQRFKLFMTSKLANPHFLPEVTIKLSIINFTVTFDGLEEQLLAEAVKNLDPEVERTRDLLVIQISSSKAEQFEI